MADLGIIIKTVFDNKGVKAAQKSFNTIKSKGSQAADKLKQSFAGMGDKIKDTGKGVISALGPAALAGPVAAIAAMATGVVSLVGSSIKLAEEAKTVSSAFRSLSGGALIATANMQAMREATKGLISETEQMRIANQLLGMNIVQTADQLGEVVGVSRRLGKEFRGLGAKDAAEEFAIMIANMSVARLDSFGLSSGRVRKRINEMMRETQGMTREAAFFQATMEEGQKTIERLGPELSTTTEQTSRLSAEWANLRAVMGEAAEGTGILKGIASGLADNLILLRNWSEAGTDIATKQQALEISIKRTKAAIEDNTTGLIINRFAAEKNREKLVELEGQYARVTNRIEVNTAAAKKQQEAMQAAIRSEEIAAENLAKREASEKKFVETQEKFARDVLRIQENTAKELASSQETFDDNRLQAAGDHTKKLASIKTRAGKDEAKAAKRLQKDLSKIDTNLKKSIIKSEQDEGKKVAKAQADFAKSDKNTRKRKQIDALADERLFQFELRNLAADGEGIAIKEALERRAIEQQIASEKAEFEKDVEQDKRKVQIKSLRDEGQEARSQLQQQATERRDDLQERNEEATEARKERLKEEIAQENESFIQKKADLNEALTDRNEAIREGERERIQEIARGLAETEELTVTQLDRMIELAKKFGPEFGEVFADGMTQAFTENLKIDAAVEAASGASIGAGAGGLPIAQIEGETGVTQPSRPGQGVTPFQTGEIVGSTGIGLLHAGEEVANPNEGQAITINGETFAVRAASQMAAAINGLMERNAQMIVDTVATNL